MKTMSEIQEILRGYKKYLVRKYKIKNLGIFGSYCRGEANENSDIDIIVEFYEPIGLGFIDLAFELEKILNQKVDLVSKSGIKPKYFKCIQEDLIYV